MTPATIHLAERLSALDATAIGDIGAYAGVDAKKASRAALGEAIPATDALALFAALGVDPVTRASIAAARIGPINHQTLALFLNTKMRKERRTIRHVANLTKSNPRVIQAALDCKAVNLNNVCKLCAYLEIHPFELCERVKVEEAA